MNHISLLQVAFLQEFLLGAIFLFLQANGMRSRRLLAGILSLLCINTAIRLLVADSGNMVIIKEIFLSPTLIVSGNFAAIMLLLYVLELIRPGWVGWKHGLFVFLPWLGISLLYLLITRISGESFRVLSGMADMRAHIGEFNVWFRFVLLLMNFGYVLAMNWYVYHYRSYYDQWCARNYADAGRMDLSWVQYIAWAMIGIVILYYLILFKVWGGAYEVHQLVYLITIGFLIYNGLFHENPYPEHYFAETMNEEEAEAIYATQAEAVTIAVPEVLFVGRLPEYVCQVEEWMATARPYLRKDFKLMDVTEVLPLNRTYLSRVFNEGMEGTFSQVVQKHRTEWAVALMKKHPDLPIDELISQSGFSSRANFYDVFHRQTGMTPKQFREQLPTGK